jgi:hypothetical protein
MHLDAAEAPHSYGALDYLMNAPGIASGVHKSKPDEAAGMLRDDARDLRVGLRIIAMEGREDDSLADAGGACAAKISLHRRVGVPRRRHIVAFAGVTVAINHHKPCSIRFGATAVMRAGLRRPRRESECRLLFL